jgi:hypothetical protein
MTERTPGEHQVLLDEAIATEATAQRALLAGEPAAARGFMAAADLYLRSYRVAPPASYGRLVGALKAAILAGDPVAVGAEVEALAATADTPTSAYAAALAALVRGDDAAAAAHAGAMRAGGDAFARAATAIAALAARDAAAYRTALAAIVDDFAARPAHLTGVAIADTAAMLERLAAPRGLASGVRSPLVP